jgi:Domain of unknown function (DUF4845)
MWNASVKKYGRMTPRVVAEPNRWPWRRREKKLVSLDRFHAPILSTTRRGEWGEGKLKAVLYTVIIVLIVYSAFKIVPVYIQDYQLSDKMQETARFAVVNRYSEDQIRDTIFKEIQSLEIPARREDIKVSSSQSIVKISVDYTVPVDLFFYHMDLHFTPSSENKSIL